MNDPSLLGKRTLKRSAKEGVDYKEKNSGASRKRDQKNGKRRSSVESDDQQ